MKIALTEDFVQRDWLSLDAIFILVFYFSRTPACDVMLVCERTAENRGGKERKRRKKRKRRKRRKRQDMREGVVKDLYFLFLRGWIQETLAYVTGAGGAAENVTKFSEIYERDNAGQ